MYRYEYVSVEELKNKVLASVTVSRDEGDDNITFTTVGGGVYVMYHNQDCCESVFIESIVGDIQDLVGHPLLLAEEVGSDGPCEEVPPLDPSDAEYGSYTWTFYKFATIKGYVDIRWYGSSNGYYSEGVSFKKVK